MMRISFFKSVSLLLFASLLSFFLIACGGSGGGGGDDSNDDGNGSNPDTVHTIGGTVEGLSGELILKNNEGDFLTITDDGIFNFDTIFFNGDSYAVFINKNPDEQTCQIINGRGLVDGSDIENIEVSCTTTIEMSFSLKGLYDGNLSETNGIIKGGDHLYVGDSSGVKIFNISDPNIIEFVNVYPDANRVSQIVGSIAIFDDYGERHIVDISLPQSPELIEIYKEVDLVYDGNYAYLTTSNPKELQVVDISISSNPIIKSTISYDGGVFEAKNGYVYGYIGENHVDASLQIIDVSDPTNPFLRGSYPLYEFPGGIVVSKDHVYIAGRIDENDNFGLTILDISNADNPQLASQKVTEGYAFGVAFDGTYVYVADGSTGLKIFDASIPETAYRIAHSDLKRIWDVYYENGFLYALGKREIGSYPVIQIIDVSNPFTPTIVSEYSSTNVGKDMALQGDYLFLSNEGDQDLQVLDISNPTNPVMVGFSSEPSHYFNTSYSFIIHGSYAFQSGEGSEIYDEGGVRIWDITDPTQPDLVKILSDVAVPNWINSITVVNDIAYLCSPVSGLRICDITIPESFDCVGFTSAPFDSLYEFHVAENKSYAAGDHIAHIFDLSNPNLPVLMGSYQTGSSGSDIFPGTNYLYVLDDPIQIVDASDPVNPILIGQYAGASGYDATVIGNKLYVAGFNGLSVFDVADPAKPKIVGRYDMFGKAVRVDVREGLIYILLQSGGIRILEEL